MKSDGKCIWKYCNEKCKCNCCDNCENYKPDYVGNPFKDLINALVGKE